MNNFGIVAISGAQSVGKTTIINKLKQMGYDTRAEITRELKAKGFKINEHGTDETQLAILQAHLDRLDLTDVVLDRSILDGIVYTHYLYEIGQIKKETLEKFEDIFEETLKHYDIMFYIKPEFDIEDDGERSTNKKFRDRVVELFDYYISKYNIPVHILSGSVEERIEMFENTLENHIKKNDINIGF